jgi:hypothetical protein
MPNRRLESTLDVIGFNSIFECKTLDVIGRNSIFGLKYFDTTIFSIITTMIPIICLSIV